MIQVIAFPLRKHNGGNYFEITKSGTYRFTEYQRVDWSCSCVKSSHDLTQMLNQQLLNNFLIFDHLQTQCQEFETLRSNENFKIFEFHVIDDCDPKISNFDLAFSYQSYKIPTKTAKDTCSRYIQSTHSLLDIFSKDQDAFSLDNMGTKSQLYTLVLLYNNEYTGHIYSWISDYNTNCSIGFGIRSRIETPFRRAIGQELSHISHYLLEGIRKFSLCKGAKIMIIPMPLSVMKHILTTLEFKTEYVPNRVFGTEFISFESKTSSLIKPVNTTPIIQNLNFRLIE